MERMLGDRRLFIEEKGKPEKLALVFLHYWGGTSRTWQKVVAELGDSFHTVAFDFPGWGRSKPALHGYTLSAMADTTLDLIQRLGLRKYVLVGHSMGGKVAQLLASLQPVGLAGLVLVAPASPAPAPLPAEAKEQQLHAYDNRETVLQTIEFLSARKLDPDTMQQIVEDSLSGIPDAKLAWPLGGMLEDISADVARIAVPTLVIAGGQDRLDCLEQHEREVLARISGSTMDIIPESGHLLPVDAPEEVAAAIRSFAEPLR